MKTDAPLRVFACNSASPGSAGAAGALDYRAGTNQNLHLGLPSLVRSVWHLPDRLLDLLEIASYVHAGDRLVHRGRPDAVEFHGWARRFLFRVRVRDFDFWTRPVVGEALAAALTFMTGDAEYRFEFEPGHATPARDLFDREEFAPPPDKDVCVALFSGGLDSLVGSLDQLALAEGHDVYLVSHASNSGAKKTQRGLIARLQREFPSRVYPYLFESRLKGVKARDETQRTRSLLFFSIAFAVSYVAGSGHIHLFENGITGINFPRRQNLINARASRTTHPQTVTLLEALFTLIAEKEIEIRNPLLRLTKTDVVRRLRDHGLAELYPSTVSCGVTRGTQGPERHCGTCNQCIDRRFAAYAAGIKEYDGSTSYLHDFVSEGLGEGNHIKSLVDFMRQAERFREASLPQFFREHVNEITQLVSHVPGATDPNGSDTVVAVHELCRRHGEQVLQGYQAMEAERWSRGGHTPPVSPTTIASPGGHYGLAFDPDKMIERLRRIRVGTQSARAYEAYLEEILPLLFEPDLTALKRQVRNLDGTEIIDVTMGVRAESGFWRHIVAHKYGNALIPVEFKNKAKLKNEDIDQAAGRCSAHRGQFILLFVRNIDERDLLRLRKPMSAGKMIAVLCDSHLQLMIRAKAGGQSPGDVVYERVRELAELIQ
jgi:7-cyano-7-deazaguanine synthase in queuosine biosynthesis